MKLFDLDPSLSWLFCFTHPDDEIAIIAWMRRLVASGAEVWAGWSVTDATREAEARAVMRGIGVRKERLFFHGMPDRCACDRLTELTEAWADAVRRARPDRIVVGAFECGHIDHDSTNFAVSRALIHCGIESFNSLNTPRVEGVKSLVLEIPLYHTYLSRIPVINRFADPAGEEVLHLNPSEWGLKRRVSRSYPSQNIGWLLFWYTLFGWLKVSPPALCRTERLREGAHSDYSTPNLPEPLCSRVRRCKTWDRWRKAVKDYSRIEKERSR